MEVITQTTKYRGVQGIYAIININKKSPVCHYGTPYVGQSCSRPLADKRHRLGIGNRICDHKSKLRKNQHHNIKLQRAWNKYGESSFIFLMIEEVSDEKILTEREQFWMDKWQAYKNGYNCQPIADSSKGMLLRSVLTKDIIVEWIKEYKKENKKFPSHNCGKVKYAPKHEPITWGGINRCLMDGFRGLSGGSTLSKFIANEFKIINRTNADKLSEDKIFKWVECFYNEHGYYPTKRSGDIVYYKEENVSWRTVDVALRNGHRGLSGKSSLYCLIKSRIGKTVCTKKWHNGG